MFSRPFQGNQNPRASASCSFPTKRPASRATPRTTQYPCRPELVDWTHRTLKTREEVPFFQRNYDKFVYVSTKHLPALLAAYPDFSQVQLLADYTEYPLTHSYNTKGPIIQSPLPPKERYTNPLVPFLPFFLVPFLPTRTPTPNTYPAGTVRSSYRARSLVMPALLSTIQSAQNNLHLTRLLLNNNFLNDAQGVQIIQAFTGNSTIQALDLSRNQFGDRTGYQLTQMLLTNESLTELNFSGNSPVTDGTAHEFAVAIEANATLTTLDLSWLNFTQKGYGALAAAMQTNRTIISLPTGQEPIHIGDSEILSLTQRNKTLRDWDYLITYLNIPQLRDPARVQTAYAALSEECKSHFLTLYWNMYYEAPADIFSPWDRFVNVLTTSQVLSDLIPLLPADQPTTVPFETDPSDAESLELPLGPPDREEM